MIEHVTHALRHFFFQPISAVGFGLMRAAFGTVAGLYYLMQWTDVTQYYSNAGVLPTDLMPSLQRGTYVFTILQYVTEPSPVFWLYVLLLIALLCTALGIRPRIATVASTLLLFSFHERNQMILLGGDVLLRNIGFLLILCPNIDAFSLKRAHAQWSHWIKTQTLLPTPTMPIWPYRLLLWQMIVLYLTSLWYKLIGIPWTHGTAIQIVLHHGYFSRLDPAMANRLMALAVPADYLSMIWEALWFVLLIPHRPPWVKRWILFGGILFHGSIFLLMDAGSFSLVIFTAYLGLLLFPLTDHRTIVVLYDGHCGLCRRSVFVLQLFDWLHRLRLVDLHDTNARKKIAPRLTSQQLNAAMHVGIPVNTSRSSPTAYRFMKGFDAFRALSGHLPALRIIAPLLYVPGIAPIGRRVYAFIARKRLRCSHADCLT